jgi:hypothetical protein
MLYFEEKDAYKLFLCEILVRMKMVTHGYYCTSVKVIEVIVKAVFAKEVSMAL